MTGRIVGADPSKNDLAFVVLDEQGQPVLDALDKLRPGQHGLPGARLLDLTRRIEQHMRRLRPSVVAIYGSTRGSWTQSDLRPRAHLEAALMVGSAMAGVQVVDVSPHDAATTFGVKHNLVPKRVLEVVDLSAYSVLKRRARALAGAWHAAGIEVPTEDHEVGDR